MSANTAESINPDGESPPAQLFVINLCASTSPMALTHPSSPELKRHTFFVSRQREDGRERFRLHMGYFASQEEAEALLAAVRDVYPAAWAGPAPSSGMPRRARVVTAPAVAVPEVVASQPVSAPASASMSVQAPPDAQVLDAMSNVRDVLAQLSEGPLAPQKVARSVDVPRLQPAPAQEVPDLNASQTLRVLEAPLLEALVPQQAPAAPAPFVAQPAQQESEVRVVTPEDTQTLRDIRLDAQNNAAPCFAAQLMWSVSPIDIAALPHLAIFDAYTLYNVEGNRQGRKWYGLRLGFFSDPNSATQVAHYVRADYPAVAVVPVAIKERDRATGGGSAEAMPRLGDGVAALKPENQIPLEKSGLDGFELIQDDRPAPAKRDLDDTAAAAVLKAPARPAIGKAPVVPKLAPLVPRAPKAAGKPTGKRVVVRARPAPSPRAAPGSATPLESTLEILGASTLSLDESREIINDSAIRKPLVAKAGAGRFSKLLSRLGGG
jgi:hypothetical protein